MCQIMTLLLINTVLSQEFALNSVSKEWVTHCSHSVQLDAFPIYSSGIGDFTKIPFIELIMVEKMFIYLNLPTDLFPSVKTINLLPHINSSKILIIILMLSMMA